MSEMFVQSTVMPRVHGRSARAQRGLSLLGLLLSAGLITMLVTLALKVAPTVNEYLAVKRAIVKARADGIDVRSIRGVFDRAAAVDDITSIDGKDLIVERLPNGEFSISFDYEKRIEIFRLFCMCITRSTAAF